MPEKKHDPRVAAFSLAEFLPYRLAVATDSISRVFSESYEGSFNLTIPEWRTLAVVAKHGPLSPTSVGHRTAMDKVKVSRAAQSLITKGLLRQSLDPTDGRGRLLRLTRKGISTYASIVPLAAKLEAKVFDGFSRADLTALNRMLTKIISRTETNRRDAPR